MTTIFGNRIRELRVKQKLLLRQVASKLDVDTSIISKVERGQRILKKEQIVILSDLLNEKKEQLLILWLADQVYEILKGELDTDDVLKLVSKKIKETNK
jgi:transcriptional regulator with XRE-family HTH domain